MHSPEKLAFRPSELAQALGVSRTTLWRLVKSGSLPQPLRLGGCVVWEVDPVKKALATLREQQRRGEAAK